MEDLKKYRAELMGIATLIVLVHHVYTGMFVVLVPYVAQLGFIGVDIFLFLSGFGLSYGFGKYKSIYQFYKKRFSRIYPTYLTVITIGAIFLTSFSVLDILIQSTGIEYYFNIRGKDSLDWYVPAIYLFYICFPGIFYLIDKDLRWAAVLLLCSFIPAALNIAGGCQYLKYFTAGRIPIFVIGVIAGVVDVKKIPISSATIKFLEITAAIAFVAFVYIVNHNTYAFLQLKMLLWLPVALIIPGLCFSLDRILNITPKAILAFLSFIGGLSLEIYLFQVLFLLRYSRVVKNHELYQSTAFQIIAGILFIIISILSGYLLSKFVKFATSASTGLKTKLLSRRDSHLPGR